MQQTDVAKKMKNVICAILFFSSSACYAGNNLSLLCKGDTENTYISSTEVSKKEEMQSYIFENGKVVEPAGFRSMSCNWTANKINCKQGNGGVSWFLIDRVSGTVYSTLVVPGHMSIFRGNCVTAKPKF